MDYTKIFVTSIGSITNELQQRETIIQVKIVHNEKGWEEHRNIALKFIERLNELIDIFNEYNLNMRPPIDAAEFWEWLKQEKFIN